VCLVVPETLDAGALWWSPLPLGTILEGYVQDFVWRQRIGSSIPVEQLCDLVKDYHHLLTELELEDSD
jgi:hypothetical protein